MGHPTDRGPPCDRPGSHHPDGSSSHTPFRCRGGGRTRLGSGGRGRFVARLAGRRGAPGDRGRATGRRGPRRLRQQPRDEARPAVSHGAAGDRRRARGRAGRAKPRRDPAGTPVASAEVAPPGFLNLRLRDGALESTIAAILADPPAWGSGRRRCRPRRSTSSSCRPTRPDRCTSATRAARSSATCSAASSRPAASGSRASTTSTTSGGQIRNLGRVDRGDPARRARPRGRLPRRLRRRPRGGTCPTTCGPRPPPPDADTDGHPRALGRRARPRGHRGQPRRPRRPLRRLDERGAAPRGGLGRARGRAPARARPRLRAGRRDLVPLDRLRRRQGPGHLSARTASRPTSPRTSAT